MSSIIERINKYSHDVVEDDYYPFDVDFYNEYFMTFLENESHNFSKAILLNVLENITWYKQTQINTFFKRVMTEEIFHYDYILVYKKHISSSSNNIISNLRQLGIIYDDNLLLDKNTITNKLKNKTIVIFDDYVGSGNTLIKNVLNDNNFETCKFIIIAYIWQEQAVVNINKFLETYKSNNVIIHEKGNVIERDFAKKINDTKTINYIKKICQGLLSSRDFYGFNNTGAMISLMGISPNNNISMIWRDDILVNDTKWIPLLNREISVQMISKYRINIFKNNTKLLFEYYKKIKHKVNINFDDYKLLFLYFVKRNSKIEDIIEILGLDNSRQIEDAINKLKGIKIIVIIEGQITFINKMLISNFKDLTNQLLIKMRKGEKERKNETQVFLAHKGR
jgi:hypothetical protein